jgi:hypothetical protein
MSSNSSQNSDSNRPRAQTRDRWPIR